MKSTSFRQNIKASLALTSVLFSAATFATPSTSTANTYGNDVFNLAKLYKSDTASFALTGRLHGDSVNVDSSQGDFDDTVWRRFRFGFKSTFNSDFTLHVEGDFNLNEEAEYNRLTDAYLAWQVSDDKKFKFLKQGVGFTADGATSSKRLLTLERNNLTNNLWFSSEYFSGVSFEHTLSNDMKYKAGIYANDGADGITSFDAKFFTLLSLTLKGNSSPFWKKSEYRFDYVYNDEDELADTRDFEHVFSSSAKFNLEKWNLVSEIAGGIGYAEQDNVWGVMVMPSYDINPNWQLVSRYTMVKGNGSNSVRLGRYEGKAVSGRGDKYNEFYSGVNYYLNQHKLKLQLGLQYTDMDDEANDGGKIHGLNISTALRLYW